MGLSQETDGALELSNLKSFIKGLLTKPWAGFRETGRDGAGSWSRPQWGAVTRQGLKGEEGEVTQAQGQRYVHRTAYRSYSFWVKDTANPWQPCRKGLGK